MHLPKTRLVRTALVCFTPWMFAGLMGASTPARAADAAVRASEVTSRLDKARAALNSSEAAMDAAYSYEGAKATLLEAFQQAGLQGPVLSRASAASSALYLTWRDAKPFYERHRQSLAAIGAVATAQKGVTAADLQWLDRSLERLRTATVAVEAPFAEMVALEVGQAQAAVKLAEMKAGMGENKRFIEQLGGGAEQLAAVENAMEEKRAQAYAMGATAAYLADAVRADSQRQLVGILVPQANRVRFEVAGVSLEGADAPKAAPAVARPGTRAGFALSEAAGWAAIATLRADVQREEAAARTAGEEATALGAEIERVQRPSDLEEVRELMAKAAELTARLESSRARIAEIPLDSPGGRDEAERLAEQVISIRKELPGVQADLKKKLSDAGLASWKRARRSERAERLATHDRGRLAAAMGRAKMAKARRKIRESLVKRALHDAEATVARLGHALSVAERAPQVERVVLRANAATVLDRRRMGPSDVYRMQGDLTGAIELLRKLEELTRSIDADTTDEALEGVRAELRLGDGPWDGATLGDSARSLGIGEVVGDDLVAVRGQAMAARYAEFARSAPDAMGVLALRSEAPLLAAQAGHDSSKGVKADARARAAADTLTLVASRLAAAGNGKSRGFRGHVQALLSAGEGATSALRPVAERSLRAVLHLPVAEAADLALSIATDLAVGLSADADSTLASIDPQSGFAYGPAGPVVEGEPIELELHMREGAPAARPGVRVGSAQLAPSAAASAGSARVFHYGMDRAGGLGAPGQSTISIHVTP
ncbi:MAG: hypothetical protein R3F39_00825 [Myxococcota bacterium]